MKKRTKKTFNRSNNWKRKEREKGGGEMKKQEKKQ